MKNLGLWLVVGVLAMSASTLVRADSAEGVVVKTENAGSYTYVQFKNSQGKEEWAAVPKTEIKVGSSVKIENAMIMQNFESPTTKKKFEKIYFGMLGGSTPAAVGAAPMAAAMGGGMKESANPHGQLAPKLKSGEKVKVAKATGDNAKTVAEIYAEKAQLSGKVIRIQGKVVKVSNGIMGKNWFHLQDGSGTEKEKNFDLTATTTEAVKVGETVTVKGTVKLDQDIGSGYFYPVLLEGATR